jgi:hypothetical protein
LGCGVCRGVGEHLISVRWCFAGSHDDRPQAG